MSEIGNEDLLNDHIELEVGEGLEAKLPNKPADSNAKTALGQKVEIAIKDRGIPNSKLKNSSIEINGTKVELGGSIDLSTIIPEAAGSGKLLQQVRTTSDTYETGTATMASSDSIPPITAGTELTELAITPKSDTNILLFQFTTLCGCQSGSASAMVFALFQGTTTDAIYATAIPIVASNGLQHIAFSWYMVAGTASATSFSLRYGPNDPGTMGINGIATTRLFGGSTAWSLTISEIEVD